ncbi:MAG: DUF6147 family protein [Lachnospiraceae bacterium]|nr:DUF6147 family protein [Lachnospiraceae bacterium]
MKRIRRLVLPLVLLVSFVFGALHAAAAEGLELLGTVVDGSVLTNETEAEDTVYPRLRGSFLSSGSGHIVIAGTRKVTVSGNTSAYQNVDQITVTLHLQQLKNGSWVTVTTLGPRTKYGGHYVSNSRTYSVDGGYYYRVTGGHTAIKGGKPESITSATNALWVP